MERRDHCGKGSACLFLQQPGALGTPPGRLSWGRAVSSPAAREGRGGEGAAPGRAVLSPAPPVPGAVLAVPRQLRSPGCPGLSLAPRPGSAPRDLHFMFPLWCYFCSTLPLSSVLSCLSFVSWAASHPLFVLCRTLLHPSPLLLLYSLFSFVCSFSFVIPFDCLFPLQIFFSLSLILSCFISLLLFLLLCLPLILVLSPDGFGLCVCLNSSPPAFLPEFSFWVENQPVFLCLNFNQSA